MLDHETHSPASVALDVVRQLNPSKVQICDLVSEPPSHMHLDTFLCWAYKVSESFFHVLHSSAVSSLSPGTNVVPFPSSGKCRPQ